MTALVIALCWIFTVTGLMEAGMVPDDFVPGHFLFIVLTWGVVGAIVEIIQTAPHPRPRTDNEHDQTKETHPMPAIQSLYRVETEPPPEGSYRVRHSDSPAQVEGWQPILEGLVGDLTRRLWDEPGWSLTVLREDGTRFTVKVGATREETTTTKETES